MPASRTDLAAVPTVSPWPAGLSAFLVASFGTLVLLFVEPGTLSLLMAQHIGVMNVAAPVAAIPIAARLRSAPGLLWWSGLAQIGLLWAWHLPSVQQAAFAWPLLPVGMLVALAAAALLFWALVLRLNADGRWGPLAALLLCGKLACLVGVLLIFAPRELFGLPGISLGFCSAGPSTLADQQLAGLLMVTACPLSYVTAAIVSACLNFAGLCRRPAWSAAN